MALPGSPLARSAPVLGLVALLSLGFTPGAAGSSTAPGRWVPPVSPAVLVRGFDPPAHAWLSGHRGIDLRSRPGSPVRAAGGGRVTYAGVLAGRGVVTVDHGGLRTTYEPVEASVRVGQHVGAGDLLGRVATGTGHCGEGTCLHLGLKRGSTYLDPRLVLTGGQAVLRPW